MTNQFIGFLVFIFVIVFLLIAFLKSDDKFKEEQKNMEKIMNDIKKMQILEKNIQEFIKQIEVYINDTKFINGFRIYLFENQESLISIDSYNQKFLIGEMLEDYKNKYITENFKTGGYCYKKDILLYMYSTRHNTIFKSFKIFSYGFFYKLLILL